MLLQRRPFHRCVGAVLLVCLFTVAVTGCIAADNATPAAASADTSASPSAGSSTSPVTSPSAAAPVTTPATSPSVESPASVETVAIVGDKQLAAGEQMQNCTVERYKIHSVIMHRDIELAVVLPPAYTADADARFATLYALHGRGAPYDTWPNMPTLRQSLNTQPMIVVSFNGDVSSWYLDSPINPQSQFQSFFFKELVPFIDSHYRTFADAHHRGVTGFSMGGYGAWHDMLVEPAAFASVSGVSGAFEAAETPDDKPTKWMQEVLGPLDEHRDAYLNASIYRRLASAVEHKTPLPKLMIACGTEDRLIVSTRKLRDYLNARNIPVEYIESPGAHNWAYWKGIAPKVIDFHFRSFTPAPTKTSPSAESPAAVP